MLSCARLTMTETLDDRESTIFAAFEPTWIERWREPTGSLTVARLGGRNSLVLFAGVPTDAAADWLDEHLRRALEGAELTHFVDQGLLDRPNAKVRNVYIGALKDVRAELLRAHVYVGDKPLLKMITSAANMVLGGIGVIHDDVESFDAALHEACR